MLAYAFPPLGGAGVQRTLKFVKYLPEHGLGADGGDRALEPVPDEGPEPRPASCPPA